MGIISNASHKLPAGLKRLGIESYFETVTYSYAVGAEKPDPRIFQAALESMGIQPRQAAHVGDNVEADVEGAARAGLTPMLIDRKGAHADAQGIVLRDLREIPQHLTA